jgi:hypothetical protein
LKNWPKKFVPFLTSYARQARDSDIINFKIFIQKATKKYIPKCYSQFVTKSVYSWVYDMMKTRAFQWTIPERNQKKIRQIETEQLSMS